MLKKNNIINWLFFKVRLRSGHSDPASAVRSKVYKPTIPATTLPWSLKKTKTTPFPGAEHVAVWFLLPGVNVMGAANACRPVPLKDYNLNICPESKQTNKTVITSCFITLASTRCWHELLSSALHQRHTHAPASAFHVTCGGVSLQQGIHFTQGRSFNSAYYEQTPKYIFTEYNYTERPNLGKYSA